MKESNVINIIGFFCSLLIIISSIILINAIDLGNLPSFNSEPLAVIDKLKPDYIFIGNSVLEDGIDYELLHQISKKEIYLLSARGSFPPLWFLYIKNYIVPTKNKPKKIFIFFNDNYLTDPESRTTGKYLRQILEASNGAETTLNNIISSSRGNRFNQFYYRIFLSHRMVFLQEYLANELNNLGNILIASDRLENFKDKLNKKFEASQQKKQDIDLDINKEKQANAYDFAYWLDKSFLPPMIQLGHENNLPLVFVRMKRRPNENNITTEDDDARKYVSDLNQYLQDEGFEFYDLTNDDNILQQWYKDSLHISDSDAFTEYFFNNYLNNDQ